MRLAMHTPKRVVGPTADHGHGGVAAGGIADHADAASVDHGFEPRVGENGVEGPLDLPWFAGELDVAATAANVVQAVASMADGGDDEAVAGEIFGPVAVMELIGAAAVG